ncbi:MAG: TolC family protein [Planctomycetota bacterium]
MLDLALTMLIAVATGCASERPYADVDLDDLVSERPDRPWRPASPSTGVPDDRDRVDETPPDAADAPASGGVRLGDGPTSLLRLIDFALDHRPETRAAWERARMAAAELGMARGAWYPVIGLEADFYYTREIFTANGFALESDQVALVPQIALNYLLFDFGRREANDDAARVQARCGPRKERGGPPKPRTGRDGSGDGRTAGHGGPRDRAGPAARAAGTRPGAIRS